MHTHINRFGESKGERAVSPVLGGILVFGLAMSLIVLIQVSMVPALNGQIEFDHNQRLQEDVKSFQSASYRVAANGAPESVDVEAGVDYPDRAFLVNPAARNGRIYTESGTVTIDGAVAVHGDVADYWDGSPRTIDTNAVVFRPDYDQYRNAPTTRYEGTVVANDFGETVLVVDGGKLVDGTRITLVTLDGTIDEQTVRSTVLTLQPISTGSGTVQIRNDTADVTITVPSSLSAEQWKTDVLAGQTHVVDVTEGATAGTVAIVLEKGVTYELRMARLGVGTGYETSTAAAYLAIAKTTEETLRPGETTTITVEARDAYNNPVSGVTVNASQTGSVAFVSASSAETDDSGRASFTFRALGADDDVTTTFSYGTTPTAAQTVTRALEVVSPEVPSPDFSIGGLINPDATDGSFKFVESVLSADNESVVMHFENDGGERVLTDVRVNLYWMGKPGNNANRPTTATLYEGTTLAASNEIVTADVGGKFSAIAAGRQSTFADGETPVLSIQFETSDGSPYTSSGASDDFFILSLTFHDGTTAVYFVPSYAK
ncbi:Ig-like domain-containing protein [Haloarchaeobius sp. TZWWS8]|uniref:Ig-like domain-containing protein n=1 Tax=Haloarchaeobius sp. TZWWS8 TaxID=3446121 RepID=UPI003EC123B8